MADGGGGEVGSVSGSVSGGRIDGGGLGGGGLAGGGEGDPGGRGKGGGGHGGDDGGGGPGWRRRGWWSWWWCWHCRLEELRPQENCLILPESRRSGQQAGRYRVLLNTFLALSSQKAAIGISAH